MDTVEIRPLLVKPTVKPRVAPAEKTEGNDGEKARENPASRTHAPAQRTAKPNHNPLAALEWEAARLRAKLLEKPR